MPLMLYSGRMIEMKTHKPIIITDGGPWAMHDMACPIYYSRGEKAVLDLTTGIFHPSWHAQRQGYMLVRSPKWLKWLFKKYKV